MKTFVYEWNWILQAHQVIALQTEVNTIPRDYTYRYTNILTCTTLAYFLRSNVDCTRVVFFLKTFI